MNSSFDEPQLAGHLLVQCLIEQGVELAFGVPGESYLAVLDGLYVHRDEIRFIVCRQEGGAAFMAEAHGKLTGRPGVCMVTRGPGACNAAIGMHTAFQDSTPMVLLVGDVAAHARDREAFQEVDFFSFFGPLAKRVERIDDARRIPEYVARAFATAMNGRPGPVVLVLPEDMLTQPVAATPLPQVAAVQTHIGHEPLSALHSLLLESERPLVIAGGGGWTTEAARALERFAEAWQLPVANAFRYQDTFDNRHALYAGDVGIAISPRLAARVRESDLILAIGPRLGEATTSGYTLIEAPRPRQKLVHVHASAEELNRVYLADLAINATMGAAAQSLATLEPPPVARWSAWTAACHDDYLANREPQPLRGVTGMAADMAIDMPAIIATLERHLPPEAVLTNGAGNFASWLHRFFRYRGLSLGAKTQLAPALGAMGYGVPAGVAAAIAAPDRTVLTLTGDGDFLMTGQELATAVQHGAKTIVVLLNNGMYGTIRMHQEREYPRRVAGSTLQNPDFVALARGYGYAGVRVDRTEQFEPAFEAALARPEGTLIEVMLDAELITTRATLSEITRASLQKQ